MEVKKDVYTTQLGEALMNRDKYPAAIQLYLAEEAELALQRMYPYRTVVEMGCHNGRNAQLAADGGKVYVGVDSNERAITAARMNFAVEAYPLHRFLCLDAQTLPLQMEAFGISRLNTVLFFPFNSLGAIFTYPSQVEALLKTGLPMIISQFRCEARATAMRTEYYLFSGFGEFSIHTGSEGVRFLSPEGLNSMAYAPAFLEDMAAGLGYALLKKTAGTAGICHFLIPKNQD